MLNFLEEDAAQKGRKNPFILNISKTLEWVKGRKQADAMCVAQARLCPFIISCQISA